MFTEFTLLPYLAGLNLKGWPTKSDLQMKWDR
uniref:Uncharacterized protein n=1 Tax=Arundo donax TaxID=35708 RepID=A0A0A9ASA2_ARUDO